MGLTTKLNTYVARKFYRLLNSFANQDSKNITRNRRRLASMDTAAFVDEFMYKTPVFEDRYSLIEFLLTQTPKEGLYLEFGVYQGKTINYVADRIDNKSIYGFDSFEGLPEDWRHDYKKGAFTLEKLPEVRKNVSLLKGWFNEVLPGFVKEHSGPCAFIHVDCDLYSSTKTVFDNLDKQIVKGTIMLFDEFFNYPGWKHGEYKALMELCERRGLSVEYLGYCYKEEQVGVRLV